MTVKKTTPGHQPWLAALQQFSKMTYQFFSKCKEMPIYSVSCFIDKHRNIEKVLTVSL